MSPEKGFDSEYVTDESESVKNALAGLQYSGRALSRVVEIHRIHRNLMGNVYRVKAEFGSDGNTVEMVVKYYPAHSNPAQRYALQKLFLTEALAINKYANAGYEVPTLMGFAIPQQSDKYADLELLQEYVSATADLSEKQLAGGDYALTVTEYVEGDSLRDLIQTRQIGLELANALVLRYYEELVKAYELTGILNLDFNLGNYYIKRGDREVTVDSKSVLMDFSFCQFSNWTDFIMYCRAMLIDDEVLFAQVSTAMNSQAGAKGSRLVANYGIWDIENPEGWFVQASAEAILQNTLFYDLPPDLYSTDEHSPFLRMSASLRRMKNTGSLDQEQQRIAQEFAPKLYGQILQRMGYGETSTPSLFDQQGGVLDWHEVLTELQQAGDAKMKAEVFAAGCVCWFLGCVTKPGDYDARKVVEEGKTLVGYGKEILKETLWT